MNTDKQASVDTPETIQWRNIRKVVEAAAGFCFGGPNQKGSVPLDAAYTSIVNCFTAKDGVQVELEALPPRAADKARADGLEHDLIAEKRKSLELSRVYDERGKQIGRLETLVERQNARIAELEASEQRTQGRLDVALNECLELKYKLEARQGSGEVPGKRHLFPVNILGGPMREYAPGKWENAVWPSEQGSGVPVAWRDDYPVSEDALSAEIAKAKADQATHGVGFLVNGWYVPARLVSCWKSDVAPAQVIEQAPVAQQSEAGAQTAGDTLLKSWPDRIWLQAGDTNEREEYETLRQLGDGITWADSAIDRFDVEYVRADLIDRAVSQPTEAGAPTAAAELTPLDYRAQGREEALAIILAEDAEDPFSECARNISNGDAGDYSVAWDEDKLRALLHIGDRKHDAYDRAEAAYWEALGRSDEAKREMLLVEQAPFYKPLHDFLSKHEAWDLMADLKRAEAGRESAAPAAFPERDLSKPAEEQGLFRKFDVRRADGSDQPGGKHYGCRYYVLDLNHDQHAPSAMRAYAAACRATHPQLADEIEVEFPAVPIPPMAVEPDDPRSPEWTPVTGPGQVKAGDKLRFKIGDKDYSQRAKLVLNAGTEDEEVIYDKGRNFYFITKCVVSGFSNHKQVEFRAHQTSAQSEGGERG